MNVLITGGAGFIGVHAANRFAREHSVTVLDNLSRRGSEANLRWLQGQRDVEFVQCDIRQAEVLTIVVRNTRPDLVLHLAAQVAVTTSVADPRTDFDINAVGTVNLLEAVRQHAPKAVLLYASTNKVYGGMEDTGVVLRNGHYQYSDLPYGVGEDQPLDFHSPYGCSKGAGDQYVRDYARIYGLRTIVFRQSCILGSRQFGVEDQGWISWFSICAVLGKPVTIYGDGKQARDLLWVDDLLDAYEAAFHRAERLAGKVFNIGGGPANVLSLLETIRLLNRFEGRPLAHVFRESRPGDQRVFIADTRRAQQELEWMPRVGPEDAVRRVHAWVRENRSMFET